uniref:Uncharacterized protein n=1 Tax=Cacopsylla melanoneura TaxID=428564 RepID=A0A8D9EFX4_9HEMI
MEDLNKEELNKEEANKDNEDDDDLEEGELDDSGELEEKEDGKDGAGGVKPDVEEEEDDVVVVVEKTGREPLDVIHIIESSDEEMAVPDPVVSKKSSSKRHSRDNDEYNGKRKKHKRKQKRRREMKDNEEEEEDVMENIRQMEQESMSIPLLDDQDVEDAKEGEGEDKEPTEEGGSQENNISWQKRWLESDHVQKVVTESKLCTNIRKRMRFANMMKKQPPPVPIQSTTPTTADAQPGFVSPLVAASHASTPTVIEPPPPFTSSSTLPPPVVPAGHGDTTMMMRVSSPGTRSSKRRGSASALSGVITRSARLHVSAVPPTSYFVQSKSTPTLASVTPTPQATNASVASGAPLAPSRGATVAPQTASTNLATSRGPTSVTKSSSSEINPSSHDHPTIPPGPENVSNPQPSAPEELDPGELED